jgi:hypothetical protein
MSRFNSPLNERNPKKFFSPSPNSNTTTLSSTISRTQRKIYTLSPNTNNNIIKNSNIYNEIKRIFNEGKFKKIEKKGKIQLKRASIFHIKLKDKNKIKLPELKIDNLNKIKKFKSPNLIKHNHLNNFLLRSIGEENDEKNFIVNSKKKEELNDEYYKINNQNLQNQTKARLKRFENYKNLHVFDAKYLDSEQNLEKKMKREIDNINIHVKYNKKKKKNKSRNLNKNVDLNYVKSERNYRITKNEHEKYFKNKITEQGLTLSRNLTLLKNELVESMSDSDEDDDDNSELKTPILFKNNLYHTIDLYKILKLAKELNCIGNNDEDDDEVDIDNVNKFKQERNEIEYKVVVLAKDKKIPKYLKSKLNSTTINKFKGATGKLFGT